MWVGTVPLFLKKRKRQRSIRKTTQMPKGGAAAASEGGPHPAPGAASCLLGRRESGRWPAGTGRRFGKSTRLPRKAPAPRHGEEMRGPGPQGGHVRAREGQQTPSGKRGRARRPCLWLRLLEARLRAPWGGFAGRWAAALLGPEREGGPGRVALPAGGPQAEGGGRGVGGEVGGGESTSLAACHRPLVTALSSR